eukprot:1222803-Rhodomonas_salina.1
MLGRTGGAGGIRRTGWRSCCRARVLLACVARCARGMGRIASARGTAGRLGGPTLREGESVFREVSLTLGTLKETFLRRRG